MTNQQTPALLLGMALLAGCATFTPVVTPPPIDDPFLKEVIEERAWSDARPLHLSGAGELPSELKVLGTTEEDARRSLALKIELIENARWSVDLADYILRDDFSGRAVLAALCRAAGRGVDVRVLVDSVGSWSLTHPELKRLKRCESEATPVRDASGRPVGPRARIEVGVVNALSRVFVRWNRRSHDKLLIVDGVSATHARVMTGGRNLSGDYFALDADGNATQHGYRDLELVVRPLADAEDRHVGRVATAYFGQLFRNPGNRRLVAARSADGEARSAWADDALVAARNAPALTAARRSLETWQGTGWLKADLRFAHELPNLHRAAAVSQAIEARDANADSIRGIAIHHLDSAQPQRIRIVSPYLFLAHYPARRDRPAYDEAAMLLSYLDRHPAATLEIVTNSPLTSDNPAAQAVIDMDTVPRLLMDEAQAEAWRRDESALAHIAGHPRIRVYALGRTDAQALGGSVPYGKLHAKFLVTEHGGFVGTDNFDYRSRLFNNEIGYFIRSDATAAQLDEEFERLKAASELWGSPEWLALRQSLATQSGRKGRALRWQRGIYRASRALNLTWLY